MSLNAVFDTQLSRIRLTGTALDGAATAVFEHSLNSSKWTTIRGGSSVTIDGSDQAKLDDYEFKAGVTNYYRVTAGSDVFTTSILPNQTEIWFKSIVRPFLNRSVKVTDHGDIVRPARNGIHNIIGSSYPIVVTDLRLSRQWTMTIKAETVSDADAIELVFASGDPLFVQVPETGVYSTIPGGYVAVGDMSRRRFGKLSERRWFDLPCTEVRAPGPDVVGTTNTWETLLAEFGSWTAILAEFGDWTAVADYVADPSVVIVP